MSVEARRSADDTAGCLCTGLRTTLSEVPTAYKMAAPNKARPRGARPAGAARCGVGGIRSWMGEIMQKNTKPKVKCRNCEGKGLVKVGDKKMKCQRCGGSGFKS